jgi:hypothetical protein
MFPECALNVLCVTFKSFKRDFKTLKFSLQLVYLSFGSCLLTVMDPAGGYAANTCVAEGAQRRGVAQMLLLTPS